MAAKDRDHPWTSFVARRYSAIRRTLSLDHIWSQQAISLRKNATPYHRKTAVLKRKIKANFFLEREKIRVHACCNETRRIGQAWLNLTFPAFSRTTFLDITIMSFFFSQFDSQFDAYITYCMEEANCLKYFKEKMTENEDFRMYILVSSWGVFPFPHIWCTSISASR